MTFDLVFFVKNLPTRCHFHGDNFFMAVYSADALTKLTDALQSSKEPGVPSWAPFFLNAPPDGICAVGIRNDRETVGDALALARHNLDALIDGLSLVVDTLPEVSPLVVVCAEGRDDGWLQTFSPTAWIQMMDAKGKDGADEWAKRNASVFDTVFPFFDVVTGEHAASKTALARQLSHSLKMYRHGAATQVFALEYIAKFSALEGLVCGGTKSGKGKMLRERIPLLFRTDSTVDAALIDKLWEFRNASVHESQGFYSEFSSETKPVQVHIDKIERLFAGVVIFAVVHLGVAADVAHLWNHVTKYSLPEFARSHRPPSNMRVPGEKMHGGVGLQLKGARALFEWCLQAGKSQQEIGNQSGQSVD
jgi:hypothetical protein